MVSNPGPGELQGLLICVPAPAPNNQLEQLITQFTHLTWLPGSQWGADFRVKTGADPAAFQDQGWRPLIYSISSVVSEPSQPDGVQKSMQMRFHSDLRFLRMSMRN